MSKTLIRLTAASVLASVACSGDIYEESGPAPTLLAVSHDEVSVGKSLEFIGTDFIPADEGYTEILLEGTFISDKGDEFDKTLTIRPHRITNSKLLWANVGPFEVPFVPDDQPDMIGVFHGWATPVNVSDRNKHTAGEAIPFDLTIGPSIIVREFRPIGSTCDKPARRLIGGFPYEISVEAIGFEPESFSFEVVSETGSRMFRVPAVDRKATFGDNLELVLEDIAAGNNTYILRLNLTARNAAGDEIGAPFAFGVHQPIEYVDYGMPQIAEIEAAQPVSGCIDGGINGLHVSYSESVAETRSRQLSVHFDETFSQEHSSQYSTSHEERNGINVSITNTDERGGELSHQSGFNNGVNGGFNVAGVVNVGGSAEWSNSDTESARWSQSTANTVGHDYSEADTESWAYTKSQSTSIATGTGSFWETSSTTTINREMSGDILPGANGIWFRQVTRIVRPGAVIVYDMCGDPLVVADAMFSDYVWAAALSQTRECEQTPSSNLPSAECFIDCN